MLLILLIWLNQAWRESGDFMEDLWPFAENPPFKAIYARVVPFSLRVAISFGKSFGTEN